MGEWVLSFHHVGPIYQTQVTKLDSKVPLPAEPPQQSSVTLYCVCEYSRVHVSAHERTCRCGGQKPTRVSSLSAPPYFLRHGLLLNLELPGSGGAPIQSRAGSNRLMPMLYSAPSPLQAAQGLTLEMVLPTFSVGLPVIPLRKSLTACPQANQSRQLL